MLMLMLLCIGIVVVMVMFIVIFMIVMIIVIVMLIANDLCIKHSAPLIYTRKKWADTVRQVLRVS